MFYLNSDFYFPARWLEEEVAVMKKIFKKNMENGILPGLKFCEETRKNNPILEKRNPTSIKAWIHNYLKKKI